MKNFIILTIIQKYLNLVYLKIKFYVKILLRPHGKIGFIKLVKRSENRKIIDIGCGNNSYRDFYNYFYECDYFGIDIDSYNIDDNIMDKIYIIKRELFNNYLDNLRGKFDIVFSSHNLEHCDDYKLTLSCISNLIKPCGYLYLSFPTSSSINFPSRSGALNYYSDTTHNIIPPDFDYIIKFLKQQNFELIFISKSYKPLLLFILGLLQEPFSYLLNKNLRFTWGYYGFESIIWAKKLK